MVGDGNCFFRTVSHSFYGTQNFHRDLRVAAVDNVVDKWYHYMHFIPRLANEYGEFKELTVDEYREFMKADGEYATEIKISSIADLHPQYKFVIHVEADNSVVGHGSGHEICHLLYSGMLGNGHYDILIESVPVSEPSVPKKRKHKAG